MDQKEAPEPPRPPTTHPSRSKKLLGIAIIIVVMCGACYLVGYLHGMSGVAELRAQLGEVQKVAQSSQMQLSKQLESEKQHCLTLEARRSLDQAVVALDARNFGIAEKQVQKASHWLVAAHAEARLAELAKTLETFHLVATEDLGPQRKQLADWVVLIDQMVLAPNP